MGTLTCFVNIFSDNYRLVNDKTKEEIWVSSKDIEDILYNMCKNGEYIGIWFEGPYAESYEVIYKLNNKYPDLQIPMAVN